MTLRLLLRGSCFCVLISVAEACSTFCLVDGSTVVYGRNYDFFSPEGWVMVNRRGLAKSTFHIAGRAQWISRYGSVGIGQFGYEFPCGGMNEAGLVIALMELRGTQYQPRGTIPTVLDLQWVQYQLDCSATVADVLASDARVRLDPLSSPLHFLVCDRLGNRAVIEFIGGTRVVYTGSTLPVAALTNDTYASSVTHAATTTPARSDSVSSLGRFVHAAAAVRAFTQSPADDPVAYAFTVLDTISQPSFTRWSAVYDVINGVVHFRTPSAREIKRIRLAALDFRPTAPPLVMDVNTREGGDVVPATLFTTALNLEFMNRVFPQLPGWADAPAWYILDRASYPDTVRSIAPPVFRASPASQTVAPGGHATLTATASGEGELTYQWYKDGVAVAGATGHSLELPRLTAENSGDYIAVATNPAGTVSSRAARLLVAEPSTGRLCNLSVRHQVAPGEPLIAGFHLAGGAKPLLVRAVGPTLRAFNVADALANPRLEVHQRNGTTDQVVGANDDWGDVAVEWERIVAVAGTVGAFPLAAATRDAAIISEVDGSRTVHVAGAPGSTAGVVLLEVYDAGEGSAAKLVNLSVRSRVERSGSPMIAGFVISGNVPRRLLLRGVGPALASAGVANVLADPRLELHGTVNGVDHVIAANDSWSDEVGAAEAAAAVGAFPLSVGSADAALNVTLAAGTYTLLLYGGNGTAGTGLIEIYDRD